VLPETVGGRVAVAVAVVAFCTGVATVSLVPSRSAARAVASAQPKPGDNAAGVGPEHLTNGIPSGFARTRGGAVAAAAAFVCTGQALVDLDALSVEDAVRSMAASASADRQVADTQNQLRRTRDALASGEGPIVFHQAVVAYRVEAFDPDRARVAVWNVGVLTRDGVAPPQAGWAISTFDLVWERDDWRIWSETVVPGPAPVLNDSTAPATPAQFVQSLDGFVDFGAHG
jgi:hypothetical protein